MKTFVELPLAEPLYKTYQNQAVGTVILGENPSINNWYLTEAVDMTCTLDFLSGRTTPDFLIINSFWTQNPHLEGVRVPLRFVGGDINHIIHKMLDEGYYVYFQEVDDYYIKGKSWYKERHVPHDGLICGYNRKNKTYCIYAYDSNWICQKFWTPQKCLDNARNAYMKQGRFGTICALKPRLYHVDFSAEIACKRIAEYLDSSLEKYPQNGTEKPRGSIVQYYLSEYVGKLYDGSIPYERKDRRIFRQVWEHKKVMLQRLEKIEKEYEMDGDISERYASLVGLADRIRMQYTLYVLKRRDSVLPRIPTQMIELMDREREILNELLKTVDQKKGKQTVGQ